jgi:hypothetical protein
MLALVWLSVSRVSQFASNLAAVTGPVAETETTEAELELEALEGVQ